MGVAYFGLVCVTVALWVGFGRLSADQVRTAQVVSERRAEVAANANAQYQQCVQSIPQLTKINRFIRGVQHEHSTLLKNSLASHAATPTDSALWQAQVKNIARLREANNEVKNVRFKIQTQASCIELRRHLLTERKP